MPFPFFLKSVLRKVLKSLQVKRSVRTLRQSVSHSCAMITALLLLCSNIFMTFAWYGHLKYGHDWALWRAILFSWGLAFFEYCIAVPANRWGYQYFSGFQLKIMQEIMTLAVFLVFGVLFLKERLAWNYVMAFCCLGAAAYFAFAFKA